MLKFVSLVLASASTGQQIKRRDCTSWRLWRHYNLEIDATKKLASNINWQITQHKAYSPGLDDCRGLDIKCELGVPTQTILEAQGGKMEGMGWGRVVFWSRVVGGCGKMTVGKDEKSTKSKNRKIDQIWSKLLYHLKTFFFLAALSEFPIVNKRMIAVPLLETWEPGSVTIS